LLKVGGACVVTQTNVTIPLLDDVSPEELRRIVLALHRAHRLVAAITDLDTLLIRIMEESKEVAQAEACSLMLYDELHHELYFKVALGDAGVQETLRKIRLKLGQGIAGAAAESRQTIVVEDAHRDDRFLASVDEATRFTTRSLLAIPLLDRNRLLGVVEVVNKVGDGNFTPGDRYVMEMFSSLASSVIANAYLIERNLVSERLAAIGQAVAGLSHHTKNILTSMNASTDLIDHGLKTGSGDLLNRGWPILKRSIHRIANLVEDMRCSGAHRGRAPDVFRSLDETQDHLGLGDRFRSPVHIGGCAWNPSLRLELACERGRCRTGRYGPHPHARGDDRERRALRGCGG
jgi:hypothetical protein